MLGGINSNSSDSIFKYPDNSSKDKTQESTDENLVEETQEPEISPSDLTDKPLFSRIPIPKVEEPSSNTPSHPDLSKREVKLLSQETVGKKEDKGKEKEDAQYLQRKFDVESLSEEIQGLNIQEAGSLRRVSLEISPFNPEEEVLIEKPDNEILRRAEVLEKAKETAQNAKTKKESPFPKMVSQTLNTSGQVNSLVGNAVVTEALQEVLDGLGISLSDFNSMVKSSTGANGAALGIIYGLLELKVLNDLKAQLEVAKEKLQNYIDKNQENQPANFNETKSKMQKDIKDLEKKISEKAISVVNNTSKGLLKVDEQLITQIAPYLKIAGASVDVFTSISSTASGAVSGSVAIYNIVQICKEFLEVEDKKNTINKQLERLVSAKIEMKEAGPRKGLEGAEEPLSEGERILRKQAIDDITEPLLSALKLKLTYLEHKAIDDLIGRFVKEILSLLNSAHGITAAILILIGLKAVSSAVLGPIGIPLVLASIGTGAFSFYSTNKIDVLKFFTGIPLDAQRMLIEIEENKYLGEFKTKHKEAVQEVVTMAQNIDQLKKRIEVFYHAKEELEGITQDDLEKMAHQHNQELSSIYKVLWSRSASDYRKMLDEFLVTWNKAKPNYEKLSAELVIMQEELVESIKKLEKLTDRLKKEELKYEKNPETEELRQKREAFNEKQRLHTEKWEERSEIFRFGDDKEAYLELKEAFAEVMADKNSEQYDLMKGYFYKYAKEYYTLFEEKPVEAILKYFWSSK